MQKLLREQLFPISLTLLTFFFLSILLAGAILLLNLFPSHDKIVFQLRPQDILIGLTIYLKTAIDFAIFIGNLMRSNPGWQNRIAIELGTALGNAVGTIAIFTIWNFFREVPFLMAIMIFLASLVLLRMAEESIAEFLEKPSRIRFLHREIETLAKLLRVPNKTFAPLLRFISPSAGLTKVGQLSWMNLLWFSATIPFILGLDDFAGYIPLFSIINVFGFAIGVFLGHMLLNAALFVSPKKTTAAVQTPLVLLIGGVAFVGIAVWGFYEVIHLLLTLTLH